ncbi:hypothetical protein J6590_069187 [Homalodisca vitripennis]|nr:hypothetical protein J6590_069187 [Homalodisca vitripennis]
MLNRLALVQSLKVYSGWPLVWFVAGLLGLASCLVCRRSTRAGLLWGLSQVYSGWPLVGFVAGLLGLASCLVCRRSTRAGLLFGMSQVYSGWPLVWYVAGLGLASCGVVAGLLGLASVGFVAGLLGLASCLVCRRSTRASLLWGLSQVYSGWPLVVCPSTGLASCGFVAGLLGLASCGFVGLLGLASCGVCRRSTRAGLLWGLSQVYSGWPLVGFVAGLLGLDSSGVCRRSTRAGLLWGLSQFRAVVTEFDMFDPCQTFDPSNPLATSAHHLQNLHQSVMTDTVECLSQIHHCTKFKNSVRCLLSSPVTTWDTEVTDASPVERPLTKPNSCDPQQCRKASSSCNAGIIDNLYRRVALSSAENRHLVVMLASLTIFIGVWPSAVQKSVI